MYLKIDCENGTEVAGKGTATRREMILQVQSRNLTIFLLVLLAFALPFGLALSRLPLG